MIWVTAFQDYFINFEQSHIVRWIKNRNPSPPPPKKKKKKKHTRPDQQSQLVLFHIWPQQNPNP